MTRALLALATAGLVSCFGPLDETGKRCSDQRPCSTGYVCTAAGVCAAASSADAGAEEANLIVNPGFEEGVSVGWRAAGSLDDEQAVVRAGSRAARISTPVGGDSMALFPDQPVVSNTRSSDAYCLALYVRGTPGVEMSLLLRERESSTAADAQNSRSKRFVLSDSDWTQVEVGLVAVGAPVLDFRLFSPNPTTPGDFALIDDVQLYRAADGACP